LDLTGLAMNSTCQERIIGLIMQTQMAHLTGAFCVYVKIIE